jgi:hypothetical protein
MTSREKLASARRALPDAYAAYDAMLRMMLRRRANFSFANFDARERRVHSLHYYRTT